MTSALITTILVTPGETPANHSMMTMPTQTHVDCLTPMFSKLQSSAAHAVLLESMLIPPLSLMIMEPLLLRINPLVKTMVRLRGLETQKIQPVKILTGKDSGMSFGKVSCVKCSSLAFKYPLKCYGYFSGGDLEKLNKVLFWT